MYHKNQQIVLNLYIAYCNIIKVFCIANMLTKIQFALNRIDLYA